MKLPKIFLKVFRYFPKWLNSKNFPKYSKNVQRVYLFNKNNYQIWYRNLFVCSTIFERHERSLVSFKTTIGGNLVACSIANPKFTTNRSVRLVARSKQCVTSEIKWLTVFWRGIHDSALVCSGIKEQWMDEQWAKLPQHW